MTSITDPPPEVPSVLSEFQTQYVGASLSRIDLRGWKFRSDEVPDIPQLRMEW